MKKYFFVILLAVMSSFAQAESARETPDENFTEGCILHEEYKDIEYTVQTLRKYVNNPSLEYFNNLTPLQKDLFVSTALNMLGFINENHREKKIKITDYLELIDDVTIEKIKLKKPNGFGSTLYRVDMGVGGGNGGYTTYRMLGRFQGHYYFKDVARTFDRELIYCDENYRKKSK